MLKHKNSVPALYKFLKFSFSKIALNVLYGLNLLGYNFLKALSGYETIQLLLS